ncbi:unnamed protein product [Bursaphelenchus okinawaensis]|uniref:Uncharacterized protein n=1 Tax=Bursaphelenchus okinawaensis TaxID=465554 RepID=A0A811KTZ8_9BILA|nr:unnamed protein product [Bursaphelenchus okinawaensis]CAG9110093.1 unnamed protein product [Bursaphelenchus okinawaensis]
MKYGYVLCYKKLVYRLRGETWAEAFSLTNYRTVDKNLEQVDAFIFKKQSICCSYTGTMALILENKQILITNIDLGKNSFELIDFSSVEVTVL